MSETLECALAWVGSVGDRLVTACEAALVHAWRRLGRIRETRCGHKQIPARRASVHRTASAARAPSRGSASPWATKSGRFRV